MILAAIIRHLDHKNVVHDPRIKSDIVQIATCLVRQLRSRSGVAEIAVASDLCRHLRKSLQATMESLGPLESNWNEALQNSIEDCLLEIAKGVCLPPSNYSLIMYMLSGISLCCCFFSVLSSVTRK